MIKRGEVKIIIGDESVNPEPPENSLEGLTTIILFVRELTSMAA